MMITPQSVPQYDVTAHEVIENRHRNGLLTSLGSWIISRFLDHCVSINVASRSLIVP